MKKPFQNPQVIIIGPQPPPVHGVTMVNASIYRSLRQRDVPTVLIDLASGSLSRALFRRVASIPRILTCLCRLATIRTADRDVSIYLSAAGGLGQIYTLGFLLIARWRGFGRFLHHHSYAYLDRRTLLAGWMVRAGGQETTHLVQSEGMATKLRRYAADLNSLIISNAGLLTLAGPKSFRPRSKLGKVGFLSNISAEKGIFEFLDVAAAAHDAGLAISMLIAGPFADESTQKLVLERLRHLPSVQYLGPRYGADKEAFLAEIDVLLFPTNYKNEAEPLTIHEALMYGAPVIAIGRGNIPEILSGAGGLIVQPGSNYPEAALAQLRAWKESPELFLHSSELARRAFDDMQRESRRSTENLLERLAKQVPVESKNAVQS